MFFDRRKEGVNWNKESDRRVLNTAALVFTDAFDFRKQVRTAEKDAVVFLLGVSSQFSFGWCDLALHSYFFLSWRVLIPPSCLQFFLW